MLGELPSVSRQLNEAYYQRIPYLLQLIPATYIVIAIQFTPETPRFLMANGREEEARDFLVKYHGNGDENDPLVNFEFEEMKETLASEQEAMRTPWKDILKAPGNKHRMGLVALMTFMPQLNGSTIISYYCESTEEMRGQHIDPRHCRAQAWWYRGCKQANWNGRRSQRVS